MKTATERLTPRERAELPEPSKILDDGHVAYAARCTYCGRKQKVLAIRVYPRNWNTERVRLCATCLLAAATYLTKYKQDK